MAGAQGDWVKIFTLLHFVKSMFSVVKVLAGGDTKLGITESTDFTGTLFHDCFSLDLDQHLRRNQCGDYQHAGSRTDLSEEFAVGFSHLFAIGDVGQEPS